MPLSAAASRASSASRPGSSICAPQADDDEGHRHPGAELDLKPPQVRLDRPRPRAERIREDVTETRAGASPIFSHNRTASMSTLVGHAAQRPLPARRPGGHRRDVDGLPRLRRDARAPRGDQAHAPRDRVGLRPARALPPRGARRRPALAPAHRRRDRRRRGRGPPLHRLRVRRGRDAQGPHPPHGPPADRRGDRLRDRDRARARRRARPPHRPPRRQAPERPHRRGGLGQGHRLRHRPLARRGRA